MSAEFALFALQTAKNIRDLTRVDDPEIAPAKLLLAVAGLAVILAERAKAEARRINPDLDLEG